MNQQVLEAVQSLINGINTEVARNTHKELLESHGQEYVDYTIKECSLGFECGKKYIRLYRGIDGAVSRSVVYFIDGDTGEIWYPASWKSPVKNFPRGNVLNADHGRSSFKWNGMTYLITSGK